MNELYGDHGETPLQVWRAGDGGSNAWTVHKFANRYVVWTFGRGTYVIGRSLDGTRLRGAEDHYLGAGYIGQFSPREAPAGRLLVNDALFVNNPAGIPPATPRDGVHGGLGCFAADLYRPGAPQETNKGLVDLNCRRLSIGSSPGIYAIANESVSGDDSGASVSMTTRYRDGAGPVFSVTYSHRFTAAGVTTTYTWQSDTDAETYIKEPRIVAVFGTVDVPIYDFWGITRPPQNCWDAPADGTFGHGAGAWTLQPDLLRRRDKDHHFRMNDSVPWCSTVTVGPGATSGARRYHRGGVSFDVVGVPRNLSVEDPGYGHDYDADPKTPEIPNFNEWRRTADGAAGIPPGKLTPCPGGDIPVEVCPVSIGSSKPICDACAANAWELGRVPNALQHAPYGQHGVFVAVEAWRASIGPWNFLERSRRLPPSGTHYREVLKF